jgi:hypothetical protein
MKFPPRETHHLSVIVALNLFIGPIHAFLPVADLGVGGPGEAPVK